MRLFIKLIQACLIVATASFVRTDKLVGQTPDNCSRTIKIGLLIQDSSYTSALCGAEMAVRIANRKGGLNGRLFELVARSMEGPWGTGSNQAVNLIFEEEVWALMGSHDGRNAHLVEQAATKSTVVLVSAWSSDPTLTQAFVPWFFNCVPNDNQQAASLLNEIYEERKLRNVVVVHENDYDSGKSLGSFMYSVKMSGKPDPILFNLKDYVRKSDILIDKISESVAGCIVFFCQPSASLELIRQIQQKKMIIPLFSSLMLLNENELRVQELPEFDNLLLIPSGEWPESANFTFRQEFQKAFNKIPGMSASFSFDGMSVLIEAIKSAGSNDREKIQKSLENILYNGVTGKIQFDEKGNRTGNFEIMKTQNGVPVKWEKKITR